MKQSAKLTVAKDDFEARPDGWERFEEAVDAAIKSGPKHKPAPKQPRKTAGRKRGKKT